VERYADAAGAFGGGLTVIAPFVDRHAEAFGGLAGDLHQGYVAAYEKTGTAPDAALLERAAQAIGG
jgi:hypothetical protein